MATTTANLVSEFVLVTDHIKELDEKVTKLKEQKDMLEKELLERFVKEGYQKLTALGKTIFVHRQLWAKAAISSENLILALKANGFDIFVQEKYNVQQLSAHIRELAKEQQEIQNKTLSPEELRELLPKPLQAEMDITEKISLRIRKG